MDTSKLAGYSNRYAHLTHTIGDISSDNYLVAHYQMEKIPYGEADAHVLQAFVKIQSSSGDSIEIRPWELETILHQLARMDGKEAEGEYIFSIYDAKISDQCREEA